MNERSLSSDWLVSWVSRIYGALRVMTEDFERLHGFPPGINRVRRAETDDQAATRRLVREGLASADLVMFYDTVGEVTWEDVGNGYFVHSARDVLLTLAEYGAVDLGPDHGAVGLVIGSNGGGLSYVTGPDGAVYRTRTASLDEPELDRVAEDLRQFLELLEHSLTRFVADGEPGHL